MNASEDSVLVELWTLLIGLVMALRQGVMWAGFGTLYFIRRGDRTMGMCTCSESTVF